jgi:hypothetical protein
VETRRETDNRERLRELTAKIATEQNHDKFTLLVTELNELLDGEKLPLRRAGFIEDSTVRFIP